MLDINKTLPSARTLAENNSVRIKGESAGYRKAARRCSPRRSNCVATSNASRPCDAPCRPAPR